MNVLVTGGAGYIGSHTCKALAQKGIQPVVYDNFVYGHEWAVQWGPFVKGDLSDQVLLEQTLKKYDIQAVIHFAAYAYVGESVENPEKYYFNNVVGTLSLLQALRKANISRIVFSSTCATYGVPQAIPIDESHPQDPVNPYGQSKLMIEKVLKDYAKAYGLQSVALRYFNAAGADPESRIGEDHDPETHLIPLALEAALGLRKALTIFGDDYDTPDGTCLRDYIHVDDLASAHIKALELLENEPPKEGFEVFNLGIGKGFSVKEVIESVERVTGKEVPRSVGPRRAGDPAALVANSSKAKLVLGWVPKYQEIDEITQTAYQFLLKKKEDRL